MHLVLSGFCSRLVWGHFGVSLCVSGCLSLYVDPATRWRSVLGEPRLSLSVRPPPRPSTAGAFWEKCFFFKYGSAEVISRVITLFETSYLLRKRLVKINLTLVVWFYYKSLLQKLQIMSTATSSDICVLSWEHFNEVQFKSESSSG